MQLGRNQICEMVNKENPEFTLDFLIDLDKFIFSTVRNKISNPTSLIYDLAPLGKWTYRNKATKDYRYGCIKNGEGTTEFTDKLDIILDMYKTYVNDKLEKKYEQFGKENHEAYLLAKKQERLQKRKETNPK